CVVWRISLPLFCAHGSRMFKILLGAGEGQAGSPWIASSEHKESNASIRDVAERLFGRYLLRERQARRLILCPSSLCCGFHAGGRFLHRTLRIAAHQRSRWTTRPDGAHAFMGLLWPVL